MIALPRPLQYPLHQSKGSLDPFRFNMFMRDLLAEHGHDITWMSGELNIQV